MCPSQIPRNAVNGRVQAGGVPPVGYPEQPRSLLDEDLFNYPKSGPRRHGPCIFPHLSRRAAEDNRRRKSGHKDKEMSWITA